MRQCLTLALIIAASLTAQAARANDSPADYAAAAKLARLSLGSQQVVCELTMLGRLGDGPQLLFWGTGQYLVAAELALANADGPAVNSVKCPTGLKRIYNPRCRPVRGP